MSRHPLLRHLEEAARAEGKSLGEWLYEALAEPFEFRGRWNAKSGELSRTRYRVAAREFVSRLLGSLPTDHVPPAAESAPEANNLRGGAGL